MAGSFLEKGVQVHNEMCGGSGVAKGYRVVKGPDDLACTTIEEGDGKTRVVTDPWELTELFPLEESCRGSYPGDC
ncbi:hypothetical protein HY439_00460 [Candidatus Microgenomates bacterium]|nr:hypothetical protein [Candidatus Microgenomates bacterium]